MKKRYSYALLFGIPGFFVSAAITITLFVFSVSLGILWLYVFGDNPFPCSFLAFCCSIAMQLSPVLGTIIVDMIYLI